MAHQEKQPTNNKHECPGSYRVGSGPVKLSNCIKPLPEGLSQKQTWMDDASCTGQWQFGGHWKAVNGETPLAMISLLEVILSDDCDDIRGLPVLIPLLPGIPVALLVPFWRQWGVEICNEWLIRISCAMQYCCAR